MRELRNRKKDGKDGTPPPAAAPPAAEAPSPATSGAAPETASELAERTLVAAPAADAVHLPAPEPEAPGVVSTPAAPVAPVDKPAVEEEDPYDVTIDAPVQATPPTDVPPATDGQPAAVQSAPKEPPAAPAAPPVPPVPVPSGVSTRRRAQGLTSPIAPAMGANGDAGNPLVSPTPPLKRVKRESQVAEAAAAQAVALEQAEKGSAGEGKLELRVAEGEGSAGARAGQVVPASMAVDGSLDEKIREALIGLSDKHGNIVKDMEEEATGSLAKCAEDEQRARDSRNRVGQAEVAVKRAEEAVRIARKAQRKLEEAARASEERAKEARYAAEEAGERLREMQGQQQREREATLGRLVVQKNSVTMAYKELQEAASQVASSDVTDTMENEAAVAAMERHVKRLNTCWLRFTMERRKFEEAVAAMKNRS